MESRRESAAIEKKKVMLTDYPSIPVSSETIRKLAEDSKDWAHAKGLVMRTTEETGCSDVCIHAPFSLLPSPFPAELFRQAVHVQDAMARLYHKIAYDVEFLLDCHAEVVKTDTFTAKLCDVLKKVMEEGLVQKKTLVIQRSDYMCHKDRFTSEYTLKQVEVNNIASSMGGHAERVSELHARNLLELGVDALTVTAACPLNKPIHMIGRALFLAWKGYGKEEGLILIVVEEVNQNQIDQRHVEYSLTEQGVPSQLIIRRTLTQCYQELRLDDKRELWLGKSPVSVVYFRAGYAPAHYPSEREWEARLNIERSQSIKAPWIGLQVANTKKVQQVLAEDGTVERFVELPAEAAEIRQTFAGIWGIKEGDPISEKIVKHAISHSSEYVLKPQLEGGGGNFFGDDIANKLKSFSIEEKSAHIIMEKFRPLVVQSYMVRAKKATECIDAVSELGIYGYAFGEDGGEEPPIVATGGHLLRTKGKLVDEGGVAVGAAVIDSPFLYEYL